MGEVESLEDRRRAWRADPVNPELRRAYHAALRRAYGREGAAALRSIAAWDAASELAQDAAVAVAAAELDAAFDFTGFRRAGPGGRRIAAFRHRRSAAELALIPGGEVVLGCRTRALAGEGEEAFEDFAVLRLYTLWEHYRPETEAPPRRVSIPPFLIGIAPLLQAQWDRIGGADERIWSGPELPIDGLTWSAARAWTRRAAGGLRLPSEAEWEYAARAGARGLFYWGDDMDDAYCWYKHNSGFETHPPREHAEQSNAFGLIDTLGNVCEWCADHWVRDYRDGPLDARPRRRRAPAGWVQRGGRWSSDAGECRLANRYFRRRYRTHGAGLRLARSLTLPEAA